MAQAMPPNKMNQLMRWRKLSVEPDGVRGGVGQEREGETGVQTCLVTNGLRPPTIAMAAAPEPVKQFEVAAQLTTSVQTALVRLRAQAFATGRSLSAVTADVVDRGLRFD
jgi:hypothetical protein